MNRLLAACTLAGLGLLSGCCCYERFCCSHPCRYGRPRHFDTIGAPTINAGFPSDCCTPTSLPYGAVPGHVMNGEALGPYGGPPATGLPPGAVPAMPPAVSTTPQTLPPPLAPVPGMAPNGNGPFAPPSPAPADMTGRRLR